MSIRTLVEINHDLLQPLAANALPGTPLHRFLNYLSGGFTLSELQDLAPTGIRILGQRHHSEELKLVVK